jgi:uncharacterized membrane protein HdeD (DUF308 family)
MMIQEYFKEKRREKFKNMVLENILLGSIGSVLGLMFLLIVYVVLQIISTIIAIHSI